MYKLNFVIFGALMLTCLTTQAFAETTIPWTKEGCESVKGTWITALAATDSGCDANHCNGMNFCAGPVGMNWFSAYIWCQSIGHKFASYNHLCPGAPTGQGPCVNIPSMSKAFWTDIPSGTTDALIYYPNGNFYAIKRNATAHPSGIQAVAMCEE